VCARSSTGTDRKAPIPAARGTKREGPTQSRRSAPRDIGRPWPIGDFTGSGANGKCPINYVGVLSWLGSSMHKLKAVAELFEGRHFHREVIILCVRWYLRFKLSLRDLVEMMAERGLSMAHTTIMRWVQRYAPEFEKRWRRFARAVGRSWRVDETYVKIRASGATCTVLLTGRAGRSTSG
jgi:hypothetical protein